MVQDDIGIYLDFLIMKSTDCRKVFLACSVFCANRSFLIEFAQIIHIINSVADIFLRCALISRRQPDLCNSKFVKVRSFCRTALPPQSVIREVPFKILHHGFVLYNKHQLLFLSFACFTTII